MTKRGTAVSETKRRIVEATLKLHTEKGIFGTSWQDIARASDVALGTVYKHFPTLGALIPACGELLMERTRPPSPEHAAAVIGEPADVRTRLRRAALELYGFYERAGPSLESDPRERALPAVQEWETYWRGTVETFARQALRHEAADEGFLAMTLALLDTSSFSAMRRRGFAAEAAADCVSDLVASWLAARRGKTKPTE
ncbi:MAG: TetR/AcrR family transcriptional regulator [Hyphomicrobiales bacterium]